jgi:hypothetical protein
VTGRWRDRENEPNEKREEVEVLSSPQGSLIQTEKRRLKPDQRELKWWIRSTLQSGGVRSGREGEAGHSD